MSSWEPSGWVCTVLAMHDLRFHHPTALQIEQFKAHARHIDLDPTAFDARLDQSKYTAEFQQDYEDGVAAHYWSKAPRVERQRWIFDEVCAFAGLTSTVPDLARFVAMYLDDGARDTVEW